MERPTKEVKLNLACGKDYRKGWVNIDNNSIFRCKVDKKADLTTLKWKIGSVDHILVSHYAMYQRPEELLPLIRRWRQWLKPEGVLEVETINLLDILKQKDLEKKVLIPLFGRQDTSGHRWAYTPKSLSSLFKQAGFKVFSQMRGEKNAKRDFIIQGIK